VATALFAQKSARKPSQVGQHQIEQFLFDRAIPSRPRAEQPGNVSVAVLFQHGPLQNLRHCNKSYAFNPVLYGSLWRQSFLS
jgi:hypothetical protein